MKRLSAALATGALTAVLMAGCVVGDGDLGGDPPDPCRLYPDNPQKCWNLWKGHIVQSCGEGSSGPTRLYFDRPDVPDSLRLNVINMGIMSLPSTSPKLFIDTGTVCDRGACRTLVAEFTAHNLVPGYNGTGSLGFWEPELYGDSLMPSPADGGSIMIDSVWRESCP